MPDEDYCSNGKSPICDQCSSKWQVEFNIIKNCLSRINANLLCCQGTSSHDIFMHHVYIECTIYTYASVYVIDILPCYPESILLYLIFWSMTDLIWFKYFKLPFPICGIPHVSIQGHKMMIINKSHRFQIDDGYHTFIAHNKVSTVIRELIVLSYGCTSACALNRTTIIYLPEKLFR